ncbi:ricin-type beta-trefoil lectin domain protein [Streptomyces actinomycinicus]|uniref:Ricin-type beta-trefoil lectin domain protein n=1 Tax=Streptomyces actinomycinicus TaxID=1695166 RepID=A0A937EL16_9ACTN|nr:ricin-type beta-trefoil lectin domain protein [Streptomyces actinomycinicus]MBL1084428.1 ricin-type beta-trefoil lectin domain protein [Streptomyces actinomycinicus]
MPTPHPPRPPYPPPGGDTGESDESLAGPLRAGSDTEASRSAALLMARHWEPAQEYAVICLAAPGPLAHMVTATAFHQVLGRLALGEPAEALRPRLLVAVRDTVVNWSGTDRITAVLPGLGKPAGGRGMRTAQNLVPENRALSDRSFHGLPRLEQALLWHTEVEAEPIGVPAGLLGLDIENASAALEQARDTFREGLARAHRELAPGKECRYYNRLLDVPIRRGGTLLPDVQEHVSGCAYCRHAAEQLGHADAALGVLLAESVLGWGARRYLESRPGRSSGPARARGGSRRSGGRRRGGGRPGLLGRTATPGRRREGEDEQQAGTSAHRAPGTGWSSRTLLTGVGVASAGLLATVLAVGAWPDGGDGTGPVASTSAVPGSGGRTPSGSATAPGTAGLPAAGRPVLLRNAAGDLCLDVRGAPEAGAAAVLADCSGTATQRWSHDADGLLRNAAGSGLCLDSHADAGVVILGSCAGAGSERGDDVRYDLTAQGELLPHWDRTLALAGAGGQAGADVVVKVRDRSAGQRWNTDAPTASPGSLSLSGTQDPPARPAALPQGHARGRRAAPPQGHAEGRRTAPPQGHARGRPAVVPQGRS